MINRLVILGLGLIGGSLAKAAKERGLVNEVHAWGHREASLKAGLELGIIDAYHLDFDQALVDADVVVVATPTKIAEQVLIDVLDRVDEKTVVTDVASVKGNLCEAARRHCGRDPKNLVLAHPIAGSEKSGVTAANSQLFVDHRVILTPVAETDGIALELISQLWENVGAEVVHMPVEEHDRVLAATSHLPHVLAYALVDALVSLESRQAVFRFAAGGFRDFTRIASSSPQMWHDIVLANKSALLETIDLFTEHLATMRQQIENNDGDALLTTFERAKQARDDFATTLEAGNQFLEP